MDKNVKHTLLGILSALVLLALAPLLGGEIIGADSLNLGWSDLGLGKIYFIIFAAWCIFLAVYSKKKAAPYLFGSAIISLGIPAASCVLMYSAMIFLPLPEFVVTPLYFLAIPLFTAVTCGYTDGASIMAVVSVVTVILSPFMAMIIYKFYKPTEVQYES